MLYKLVIYVYAPPSYDPVPYFSRSEDTCICLSQNSCGNDPSMNVFFTITSSISTIYIIVYKLYVMHTCPWNI